MHAHSAAHIVANSTSGKDEGIDRSVLYSFTPSPASTASTVTLKSLGLAVRGVLQSICGEKTHILRMHQAQHGEVAVVFVHLQLCMVLLVLPGWLPDPVASSLALGLAQCMVLLAGPSPLWVELLPEEDGGDYLSLLPTLPPLFDRLCDGLLRQVGRPGWARGLPSCVMDPGVLYLSLGGDKQAELEAMLSAHEADGQAGARASSPQPASSTPQYSFYCRSCCLMYRGLTVWSGLTPPDTRLTWQLCWALGVHSQVAPLPCQVAMHRIYPAAPNPDACAADGGSGGDDSGAAAGAGACGRGTDQSQPSSLLILVSACHVVLAVVLTAYDEDIEEAAGQVEASAAVELLARVHATFSTDLSSAAASSALLHALAWPESEAGMGGGG
ncbi:hypothetical protein FOA52_000046, partial [Chlamydomonas sp. UWO 241]